MTLTNVVSHFGDGGPEAKKVVDGLHVTQSTCDNLSLQGGTYIPVTENAPKRTMRPMGSRATTPKEFKAEFSRRLRAARELKYEQASDFAADLGIPPNTYGKYESGRSLLPHHLIPRACLLLGVDVKTLFEFERRAMRKVG